MRRLTLDIFAHVDAGKTTLTEAMLYACGAIRKLGRVEHGDAFLDTEKIEKERGITIYSKQALLRYEDIEIQLLDTPGHVDFAAEAERTIQALDCALLLVSAQEGVQSHTETIWYLLERYNVPTLVFINKVDLSYLAHAQILQNIQQRLEEGCRSFAADSFEDSCEYASLCAEDAMEEFLETGVLPQQTLRSLFTQRSIFPVYFGSALKGEGIQGLLEGIKYFSPSLSWPENFGARCYKVSHDERNERLTWLKVTGGELHARDTIEGQRSFGAITENWSQKVHQIRLYSGSKFEVVENVSAGQVCAVTGLDYIMPGECLGNSSELPDPVLEPVMAYKVVTNGNDVHKVLSAMRVLANEDPMLRVEWNEQLQEVQVQLMGAVQREVIQQVMKDRFGMLIDFGAGSVLYKETVLETVEGIGHFEPLRHYAEAHILLEPTESGSGLSFGSVCSEDDLDRNWQRLIATHLVEKTHVGTLVGGPLTDLRMTILGGRAHAKHTEGGDFRQSTYRAIRQGLMKAKCELLEPWYSFTLVVPQEQIGRAMSDIQKMSGTFNAPQSNGDRAILKGEVPVSEVQDYAIELASYTRGQGSITFMTAGYRPCHNREEVISRIDYDAERDLENTPDSVFCSHGAGYTVKWHEVDQAAHVDTSQTKRTPWREINDKFFSNR